MPEAVDWAALAVEKLLLDLTDRRGLKQEWWAIDPDIQQEIRERWAELLREAHDEAGRLGLGA